MSSVINLAPTDTHYSTVVASIINGQVIPFFGAGANLCERPEGVSWKDNPLSFLPSGRELACHLVEDFLVDKSVQEELKLHEDLMLASQYVDTMFGQGPLYEKLQEVFDEDRPPTGLHQFFAKLPRLMREKRYPKTRNPYRRRLIVATTNYDDLMERAFSHESEPYHVISYETASANGAVEDANDNMEKFLHWPPYGGPIPITTPNEYVGLNDDFHPVILKIHGAVYRTYSDPSSHHDSKFGSYVITEDHYIDYLLLKDLTKLLPMSVVAQLNQSNFLFLGYKLRDWNLRAILRRIWLNQRSQNYKSWAVMLNCTEFDEKYWAAFELEVFKANLKDYIKKLNERLLAVLEVKNV